MNLFGFAMRLLLIWIFATAFVGTCTGLLKVVAKDIISYWFRSRYNFLKDLAKKGAEAEFADSPILKNYRKNLD